MGPRPATGSSSCHLNSCDARTRQSSRPRPRHRDAALPDEITAQEYQLKLYYAGKSSAGVRFKAGPRTIDEIPGMLTGIAKSDVEMVEPLPIEFSQATPSIVHPSEAMQWLNAHHASTPITRHALVVLESIDAIDLAFDTFACGLLDGETDTSGLPRVQRDRRWHRLALG